MNRILITGATGRAGRHVVSQLLAQRVGVRAMVRDPDTAGLPPEIEVARGDLTIPETLERCLEGIDTVFLVWCAPEETVPAAMERIAEHARRIVFLSSPYQTAHPLFQGSQPNPIASLHAQIEGLIRASGREWTFLRPGMFAANALWWWAPKIRAGDVVRWPYGLAPSAPIDERDIAAVAVRALCDSSCAGAEYVLTGPESLTHREQVHTIGEAIGRALRYKEIPPEEWLNGLEATDFKSAAKMLLAAWAAAVGHPALITSTVAEITGRAARTFREWAADNATVFRGER